MYMHETARSIDVEPAGSMIPRMKSARNSMWRSVTCMVVLACVSGCGTASMIGRSTRALEATSKTMNETRDALRQTDEALRQTDQTMNQLVESLDKLGAPMQKLGNLAAPMRNLSALEPSMQQLGSRMEGVETNLQRLERPLENVAGLIGPLQNVGGLEEPLQDIASVGRDKGKAMAVLSALLVAWIGATFVGVYFGFVVGLRRMRRRDKLLVRRLRAKVGKAT